MGDPFEVELSDGSRQTLTLTGITENYVFTRLYLSQTQLKRLTGGTLPAWNTLYAQTSCPDTDARNALRVATPQLVGNLDGIPYQVRDLANRSVLTSTMRGLDYTIRTELGRTAVEKAKLQLSMLKSISNALGDASGNTNRTLMSLDVTGQGRAAIIVGDLDRIVLHLAIDEIDPDLFDCHIGERAVLDILYAPFGA